MRVSVVLASGRELACLDADPSWKLPDLLDALPRTPSAGHCERRVFFGETEIRGGMTFADIKAHSGVVLNMVLTPGLRVIGVSNLRACAASIWSSTSGECLCTLEGHTGRVTSAQFSPDGERALTTSLDLTARLWITASRKCLFTLQGHDKMLTSAAFSPDGKQVLLKSQQTVKLRSAVSGECAGVLHGSGVTCAAFCNDGQQGPGAAAASATFSPDGLLVLITASDRTARIWSAASGECLQTLEGHRGKIISAAFSPNAQQVLTISTDFTTKIWLTSSGECCCTLEGCFNATFAPC